MKFSIPYNGENLFREKLSRSGLLTNVTEIYFAGNPMIMSSGRRPKVKGFMANDGEKTKFVPSKYDATIKELIRFGVGQGIKMNLLMNFDKPLSQNTIDYISTLINEGVSMVTVGSMNLLAQVKKLWPNQLDIQNSVYINAASYNDIENLVRSGVSVFLLPPEMNEDFPKIHAVHKILKKHNAKLKIMVNEGCLKSCLYRKKDQLEAQEYKVESAIQDYLDESEKRRILPQPCRTIMNNNGISETNFVHPSNLYKYKNLRPIVKIVGRSFDTERILLAIRSYLTSRYEGDLRLIIENFKHSQTPVYFNQQCKTNFLVAK